MEQNEKDTKLEQEQDKTQNEAQPTAEQEVKNTEKETTAAEDHSRKARKKRTERQVDELTSKIEEMGHKLAEMNDKYMRIYSEYENYRKRTSLEKAGLILNGGKDVIKLMLPVIDDMERALANMTDDTAKEGMQLIHKNMLNALQQKGLKPMEAMGAKFDENFHEAITQIPAPTPEAKGTVIDVVKKGYFLNEEVLRFAQVVVAN